MDVHIRNVPEQATENQLKAALAPFMKDLSISKFICQKQKSRKFANLSFFMKEDSIRFLERHGQTVNSTGRRVNGPNTVPLLILGSPVYCVPSNKAPDPYLLRSMEMEIKQETNTSKETPAKAKTHIETEQGGRTFNTTSFSCGVWAYEGEDLVFIAHKTWNTAGTMKFQSRRLTIQLTSGKKIMVPYAAIYDIAITNEPSASMNFTLSEAPHFAETDNLAAMMSTLSMDQSKRPAKDQPVRITSLGGAHQNLVASCLVYRVTTSSAGFNRQIEVLRHAREIPPIFYHRTHVRAPTESWSSQMRRLRHALGVAYADLPFAILFQMQKLAQNGFLSPAVVMELLPEMVIMVKSSGVAISVPAVEKLRQKIPFAGPQTQAEELSLATLKKLLKENEKKAIIEEPWEAEKRESANVATIYRATVTPTGVYLFGPDQENKNRVLRKYPNHNDYFLRVLFADEDGQPVRYDPRISNDKIFNIRFRSVLNTGINIAGRQYAFLGFSHSSLRSQTCWFMAPFLHNMRLLFDRLVIADLGDFSNIRSPAKCAARIGQAFSETPTTVPLTNSKITTMPDVERNGRVFSDGVGTFSMEILDKIWDALSNKHLVKPTCFQIRHSGAKGMISLDSRLEPGAGLFLRPSMIKFPGLDSDAIELCSTKYRPLPMYLNRQTIKIMEDLGVEDKFFLNLQAKAIASLRASTTDADSAAKFLRHHHVGSHSRLPWLVKKLSFLHLSFQDDEFLQSILEMTALVELRALKYRSRILVENGVTLWGVMDETGILEEGEIFCIMDNARGSQTVIVGDRLIITRAPALHPGDVRLVRGVQVPKDSPLRQLSNCICFSQKGARDLPSQLSGGDLDGDLYNLMWDSDARLKLLYHPADYPRQNAVDIGRTVERDDMTNFFVQFMATDQLGRIATLHQVLADQRPTGTADVDCIRLAEMHSTAVDFSKTGIPVDMSNMPRYSNCRPDFMAPGPYVRIEKKEIVFSEASQMQDIGDDDGEMSSYRFYKSDKILGKLYRAIDEQEVFKEIQRYGKTGATTQSTVMVAAWRYVQRRCATIQWQHLMSWARDIRDMYEECLINTMIDFAEHPLRPLSEIEVVVGNILGKTGAQNKQQRDLSMSMKETFDRDVAFTVDSIIKENGDYSSERLERSMACFSVSFEERLAPHRVEKLRSFMYVAGAVCLKEMEG